jgi:23S rRNA G2445 N2-methylase RlmL
VTLARGDFRVWQKDPHFGKGRTIVANPPYGERLESRELARLKEMYTDLGTWISTEENLSSALILPEDCRRWLGDIEVEFEQDIQNGKIDVQLIRCKGQN